MGIRATARVLAVAPNTGLQWLVEAAEPLRAFGASCLCALHGTPRQRDALYAVRSAVKAGASRAAKAIKCWSRSPHGVWGAIAPVTQLRRPIDVGARTLAMAQGVVQQGTLRRAPGGVPLFLTAGHPDYGTALLAHCGHGVPPLRRQGKGPRPTPRWRPRPALR